MKRLEFSFRLECGVAAAMICLCAAPVSAQAAAAPAKTATPRPTKPPVGPGSLHGIWNHVNFKDFRTGPPVGAEPSFNTADGEPIPMRPEIAKLVAERRAGVQKGLPFADNSARCITDGMPSVTSTPAQIPFQILETPGQITFLYEYFSIFRIVHMNEKHPEDPDPTYMGHAVGHWEGDTLVVDTVAITDKTSIKGVIPHSEALHIVERIRRTGPTTMEDWVTIEDPGVFTKPWRMVSRFKQVPGMQIGEYVCANNRNAPDESGTTGVQLLKGQ